MRKIFCVMMLAMLPLALLAKVGIVQPKVENMDNPLGLDTDRPRFSWKITSDKNNVKQEAYQILVASSKEMLDKGEADLWNSGEVKSADQLWIAYAGKQLKSNQRAYWKVMVKTNRGKSEWSKTGEFGIGLLGETKWGGRWIGMNKLMPGEQTGVLYSRLAARYIRKEVELLDKEIKRATAYVSGLGIYRFFVNVLEVGSNEVLKPVPSDYRKTVYYNAYDITNNLNISKSQYGNKAAFGIILGNGRYYAMRQEKPSKTTLFGLPCCRINIFVEYADGTTQRINTDESWKITANGPIRANNEYDGEEYDARMELHGWAQPGYDDSKWQKSDRAAIPYGTVRGQMTPNMRAEKYGTPKSMTMKGDTIILDFGQNMAGWVSLLPKGKAGDTILVRYAERLQADGHIYVENLRNARSRFIYVCNGNEQDDVAPSLVYHGFRFVEITGMKDAKMEDFMAYTVDDKMATIGTFACSDTILNKVMNNAFWGIKGNYKGMPVDCPQRNERQPWLGDRTVGSLGESFIFDNERLYTKWMRDICESQREDGVFSDVAPAFWNYYNDDVTWPAALPFSCEMLYRQYGNIEPVERSYPYIKKWLNHITKEYNDNGIITKDKYGDWCMPPEGLELIHSKDPARQTDGQLIATAYTIRCMQVMAEFAEILGLEADKADWLERADSHKEAFNKRFLTVKRGTSVRPGHVLYPDSVFYGNNTATANLLPLAFGIAPDDVREEVMKNVVENIIVKNDGHVSCGVIGISWLMRGLSDNGFADIAYLLATDKKYPSWGYMAENGATTIWELWNGNTANPRMNSGNHVMLLGDLVTWAYQYLGGIRNDKPAYSHIVLKPSFEIQDCFNVDASYESPYGKIVSRWKKTLQHLEWDVEIPCNTTADVYLPNGKVEKIGSGKYHFSCEIPTSHPAIVKDEFPYEFASFPQMHSATIEEMPNGDLVAAYFGGKHERNPDVCIWVSRKPKGADKWEAPILAGDGVFNVGDADALIAGINDSSTVASVGPILPYHKGDNLKRKACWNPVLYRMPDGELWLFYKIGLKVADWTGWIVKSKDGGKTWSKREPLKEGFIGPVKNKPVIVNNRLLCPSSTEVKGWKFHVEIYDLATKEWKYVGPIDREDAHPTDKPETVKPIDCIQPSILQLKDGRLEMIGRTRNGKLAVTYSSDGGDTWTKTVLSDVPNNQSGTDAVTLKDGLHVIIYNNFSTIPGTKKGPRTPVSLAISDDGWNWRHFLTLEDSPISQYSYPAIIQGRDGTLHCIYTWRRQKVAYKAVDLKKVK